MCGLCIGVHIFKCPDSEVPLYSLPRFHNLFIQKHICEFAVCPYIKIINYHIPKPDCQRIQYKES